MSLNLLIQENNNFKFLFVVPIPTERQIHDTRIQYLGSISSEIQMMKFYSQSDVLVVPSFSEGMPTVILEAMAQNLAIIGTDVGAVRAMVSMENGFLITPGNVNELTLTIKKIIEMPSNLLTKQKKTL
jgi:glycosyltransferase involved in cell wall biosynthesis